MSSCLVIKTWQLLLIIHIINLNVFNVIEQLRLGYIEEGIRVFIHPPNVRPTTASLSFAIQPGTYASIAIQTVLVSIVQF